MKRFDSKPVICIVDDDDMILEIITKFLKKTYHICTFTTSESLLEKPKEFFDKISIFIFDIQILNSEYTGIDLSEELFKRGYNHPRLFMSGNFSEDEFDNLSNKINPEDYTFDFVGKPILFNNLKNRIKILVDVFKYQRLLEYEKEKSIEMVWQMLNHSLLFIVMIDCKFNVKLANHAIAKELEFETEEELVGKNWLDFTEPGLKETLKNVHKSISNGEDEYKEFSYQIYSKTGKSTKVKWFNSYTNSNLNLCVGIGTPFRSIKSNESIESIRTYFQDIVEQDHTMIQALKQTMIKNNNEMNLLAA